MKNHKFPEDGLLVSNSGLSIISVFFPRYFDELELLTNGRFINNAAAIRATFLTQYLITGNASFEEPSMVLNKIICGVAQEEPLPNSIEISSKEAEISEILLKSVLMNWDKIKNKTIETFREGFLSRKGLIYEFDQKWELKVEKSGVDILLDYLPWSYGHIKLPWMNKPLTINWR